MAEQERKPLDDKFFRERMGRNQDLGFERVLWEEVLRLRRMVPADFEFDEHFEGGQPNGVGTIEATSERETHRRKVITFTGPWEALPLPKKADPNDFEARREVIRRRLRDAVSAREKATQEHHAVIRELDALNDEQKAQEARA